jgi:hypothetical protein
MATSMRESTLYQRGDNANRPSEAVLDLPPADASANGLVKEGANA